MNAEGRASAAFARGHVAVAVYPERTRRADAGTDMPLHVLVLDDDPLVSRAIARHLTRRGVVVTSVGTLREASEALGRGVPFDALVLDVWLPDGRGLDVLAYLPEGATRPPIIVMTGEATVETAVGALRVGAIDYLLKPFSNDALDAALARVVEVDARSEPAEPADGPLAAAWARRHAPEMLGEHPTLLAAFGILRRVADTDCAILVRGETGTGKELVARAVHAASGRRRAPFVAINCAAIPETLIESELFGHTRGAFTGATNARIGRFQEADGGTIFLDEVGEMPVAAQAKLLRTLQEKEIAPLGSSKRTEVDVRIVAATHRDLDAAVAERRFREDLLYRLDVIRVDLPTLRAREGDIPLLARHFVDATNARRGTSVAGFDAAAMDQLRAFAWPGNVRQLKNLIERMVLLRGSGTIGVADLPGEVRRPSERAGDDALVAPILPERGLDLFDAIERFETALIQQALDRAGWNKNRAAEILRINRTTLVEKLRKRGLARDPSVLPGPATRDPDRDPDT